MPWKARNWKYRCPKCEFVIGAGKGVSLKRVNGSESCPKCGVKLVKDRCQHHEARKLGPHMFCRGCNCIVDWVEG